MDLLFPHPNETGYSKAMAKSATICRNIHELQEVLASCSPAPEPYKLLIPWERSLVSSEGSQVVNALASGQVWVISDAGGSPVGVLTHCISSVGMAYGSVVASNDAALEACLITARTNIPQACRFYFIAGGGPLKLMRDQVTKGAIWARKGTQQST